MLRGQEVVCSGSSHTAVTLQLLLQAPSQDLCILYPLLRAYYKMKAREGAQQRMGLYLLRLYAGNMPHAATFKQ